MERTELPSYYVCTFGSDIVLPSFDRYVSQGFTQNCRYSNVVELGKLTIYINPLRRLLYAGPHMLILKMVPQIGFEPMTNSLLHLITFVSGSGLCHHHDFFKF